jgi:hypothetical protein
MKYVKNFKLFESLYDTEIYDLDEWTDILISDAKSEEMAEELIANARETERLISEALNEQPSRIFRLADYDEDEMDVMELLDLKDLADKFHDRNKTQMFRPPHAEKISEPHTHNDEVISDVINLKYEGLNVCIKHESWWDGCEIYVALPELVDWLIERKPNVSRWDFIDLIADGIRRIPDILTKHPSLDKLLRAKRSGLI